jgi:hypothetical protein
MKAMLLVTLLAMPCTSLRAWVAFLETPSFRIEIEHSCEEGCVSCDRIWFRGASKNSQLSITLTGSTVHSAEAAGKTPARFLGYRFVNGSTVYFVGDEGRLEITRGETLMLLEHGAWNYGEEKPNK